jgi:membrane protein
MELVRRVWTEIDSDAIFDRAAQLSYYFILALFPLLIFLSALLGVFFSGRTELYYDLLNYLQRSMPRRRISWYAAQSMRSPKARAATVVFGTRSRLVDGLFGNGRANQRLNVAYEVKSGAPGGSGESSRSFSQSSSL